MKRLWLAGPLCLALVSQADAGQLRNSFTSPAFEATITGPDTCAVGTVPEATNVTARRQWSGTSAGQDSLVNVAPNTACVMTAGVPAGNYHVTVDFRDANGNWSCPFSADFIVHGKPARLNTLGATLRPRALPAFLAASLQGLEVGSQAVDL